MMVTESPQFTEMWPAFETKMQAEGLSEAAIEAFKYNYKVLTSGANTMIPEATIEAVPEEKVPAYEALEVEPNPALLRETVILKLNGGLGTGMGLDMAKSLLEVTALSKHTELGTSSDLEFVQNKAPKVTAADLSLASWPAEPGHEWCRPGHGDLYPAMLGSGTLDKLVAGGFKYMFVSNSDNIGATMDLKLLAHFAASGAPFMMEVATRTDADKKGGHLAVDEANKGLLLREVAQCPNEDEKELQNVEKYGYFNTNNLWMNLAALQEQFKKHGGCLPLPGIKNSKTVDPRDKASTKVLQLEAAMGAAISCFDGAMAVLITRSRFAPVKTTNDLFALRSDAYVLTDDSRIQLHPDRAGVPPNIKLDGMYKFVDTMDKMIPNGPPSLLHCSKLVIEGDVVFAADVMIKGSVTVKNSGGGAKEVVAGTYEDTAMEM